MIKCSSTYSQFSPSIAVKARSICSTHTVYPPMPNMSLPVGLCSSLESQAMCFFFSNYVLTEDESVGNFQYLRDIYTNENIGPALSEVLVALGLAGLSTFWKAPALMTAANMKYTSAVRLINAQLDDSEGSKSDQTFVAIMSLCLYEVRF